MRQGDIEHENSGIAVVMSGGEGGTLPMEMGGDFVGESFYDVMGNCAEPVVIDKTGMGDFKAAARNVSIWVRKKAFEDIIVNE